MLTERQALLGAGVAHLVLFAALSIGWQWSQRPLDPAEDHPRVVANPDVRQDPAVTTRRQPAPVDQHRALSRAERSQDLVSGLATRTDVVQQHLALSIVVAADPDRPVRWVCLEEYQH